MWTLPRRSVISAHIHRCSRASKRPVVGALDLRPIGRESRDDGLEDERAAFGVLSAAAAAGLGTGRWGDELQGRDAD